MTFGETLCYLLDCKGLTQKEFAALLNLSPSTISGYIQGTREPDFETLRRIADYFRVSMDYLLGYHPAAEDQSSKQELLDFYSHFTPSQRKLLLEEARLLAHYNIGCGGGIPKGK